MNTDKKTEKQQTEKQKSGKQKSEKQQTGKQKSEKQKSEKQQTGKQKSERPTRKTTSKRISPIERVDRNLVELDTLEDKINQLIYNYRLNNESLDKIAAILYSMNRKDVYEGLGVVEKSIKNYLYQRGISPNHIQEKTKEIIEYIKEYLSMIIAQNVVTKINGENFLDKIFKQNLSNSYKY
jgi:hypothetical protein